MTTIKQIAEDIINKPNCSTEVLDMWRDEILDEVNKILLAEVRGYEGCVSALDKINQLRKKP